MENFQDFGLNDILSKSLAHMKYDKPTPIQVQAIPLALSGRDVLGSAQTGTGKTAAFAIPLVEFLLNSERGSGMVITPTRELGKQVMDVIHQLLGPKSRIRTAFLIGGESMSKQYAQLQRRPRLIVGTPGRINDHMERGNLMVDHTKFLVLDETDRMLDMGFSIQIDKIVKHMKQKRQTLLFSATMPDNIMSMANKYMNNPERISVGSTINPAENIQQDIIRVDQDKKYETLVTELTAREGSIIVFVKTKRNADRMSKRLNGHGFDTDTIHGDLKQNKRDRVIKNMRAKKFRILVATDVVARGLDIPHIEHVINFDLPQMPEDYIHRIGRTARAGAKGHALCLIAPHDVRLWAAIEQLMFPDKHPKKSYAAGPDQGKNKGRRPFKKRKFNGKPGEERAGRPFKRTGKPGAKRPDGNAPKGANKSRRAKPAQGGNKAPYKAGAPKQRAAG